MVVGVVLEETTSSRQGKQDLHGKVLRKGRTLLEGRVLVRFIEVIERCELCLCMADPRLFEGIPGLLRLDGHGCVVGLRAVGGGREGGELAGGREAVLHGGRDREKLSTKSLTTV